MSRALTDLVDLGEPLVVSLLFAEEPVGEVDSDEEAELGSARLTAQLIRLGGRIFSIGPRNPQLA